MERQHTNLLTSSQSSCEANLNTCPPLLKTSNAVSPHESLPKAGCRFIQRGLTCIFLRGAANSTTQRQIRRPYRAIP